MNRRNLDILVSPGFILGLCLLLLNDFLLKASSPGWFTGKLSDFAGLFVFPLFWLAFLPGYKKIIFTSTAILFLLWKSTYSQPLIDYWNALSILPLSRTVDASDLLALAVLPLSYVYSGRHRVTLPRRFAPHALAAVSLFAFTATSYRAKFDYGNKYYLQVSKVKFLRGMYRLHRQAGDYGISTCSHGSPESNIFTLRIPSDFCLKAVDAKISVVEEQGQSILTLLEMEHDCPEGSDDKEKLRAIFEKEFVEKLKQASFNNQVSGSNAAPEFSASDILREKLDIYFVPFGGGPDVKTEALADYFKSKYGLGVKILPRLPLDESVRRCYPNPPPPCGRPDAEKIVGAMRRAYTKIAQNPKAIMIAIADDMYVVGAPVIYPCAYRAEKRFSVISAQSLDPVTYCEPANNELLEIRLQKVLEKEMGRLSRMLLDKADAGTATINYDKCDDLLTVE